MQDIEEAIKETIRKQVKSFSTYTDTRDIVPGTCFVFNVCGGNIWELGRLEILKNNS